MAAADARTDYLLNCMGCHLVDGAGSPPAVPRLSGRVGYYLTVDGGREYLVQVPGARQAPLDDAKLAAVLNWIVDEYAGASRPAGFEPYTIEEVTRLRARPVPDIDAERHRLHALIDGR